MATVNFTQQIYTREVLQAFIKKLAPIRAFAVDASPNPEALGTVVKLAIVKNASATATDTGNYEIDGGDLEEIAVTLNKTQFSGMAVTDRQLVETQGASLLQLSNAYQAGAAIANSVLADVFSLITTGGETANVPNAVGGNFNIQKDYVTAANNAFTVVDVQNLLVQAENANFPKVGLSLVLGPTQYYSLVASLPYNLVGDKQVISTGEIKEVFGLDSVFMSNVLPAQANCVGFLASRQAMAVAFRHIPAPFAQEYISTDVATDEHGVTIGYRRHYARATRKTFDVWDTLYGFSVADPAALILVDNHS